MSEFTREIEPIEPVCNDMRAFNRLACMITEAERSQNGYLQVGKTGKQGAAQSKRREVSE